MFSAVRLPVELSCLESMMPLHSAIASARLTSSLSIESKCWGLTPQGAVSVLQVLYVVVCYEFDICNVVT